MFSINFTKKDKTFCLNLRHNRANSYLFVNSKQIHEFKAKDSEIAATPLGLGNISKDWSIDNMKKTGLNGCLWFWWDTLDIHNNLMKKNDIVKQNVY